MYRGGTLSAGPFSLPYTWIFVAASLVAGYLVFTVLMRKNRVTARRIGSILVNSLLIWIGIWKASPLLFQWKVVTSSPLLLLYLPGGLVGSFLGLAGAGAYIFFAIRKSKIPWKEIAFPLAVGIGTALSVGLVLNLIVLQPAPEISPETAATAETGISPGNRAPDFTLTDLDGNPRRLDDFRGKLLFLNFWATWCPPCRAEIPEMVRFYRENTDKAVEIAAINLTSSEPGLDAVYSFVQEQNINFPILLDDKNMAEELFQITAVPTTFVISPEGIVLIRKTGSINSVWLERQLSY